MKKLLIIALIASIAGLSGCAAVAPLNTAANTVLGQTSDIKTQVNKGLAAIAPVLTALTAQRDLLTHDQQADLDKANALYAKVAAEAGTATPADAAALLPLVKNILAATTVISPEVKAQFTLGMALLGAVQAAQSGAPATIPGAVAPVAQ